MIFNLFAGKGVESFTFSFLGVTGGENRNKSEQSLVHGLSVWEVYILSTSLITNFYQTQWGDSKYKMNRRMISIIYILFWNISKHGLVGLEAEWNYIVFQMWEVKKIKKKKDLGYHLNAWFSQWSLKYYSILMNENLNWLKIIEGGMK